jgi:hypothetical protein
MFVKGGNGNALQVGQGRQAVYGEGIIGGIVVFLVGGEG